MEGLKFKPPPHLHPTRKDTRPFFAWSIDLMVVANRGAKGEMYIVVAVDAMTKWVELGALCDKTS